VFKHYPLPFHNWAESAAVAAECAGEQSANAFWSLHDFYFENQKSLNPNDLIEESLRALKSEDVDSARFRRCVESKTTLDRVKADITEGLSLGVNGTPHFIVNGRPITGAQPLDSFRSAIEAELQVARVR
jgi:protein-disulfide isomerase